jgi:hypothetical protein
MPDNPSQSFAPIPVRRVALTEAGVSPRQLLRASRRWRRTSRGLYLPAGADPDSARQRVVSSAARLPAEGAVGEWASGLLHGLRFCDGLDRDGRTRLDVPLYIGRRAHIRAVDGTRVSRDPLPAGDVDRVDGIRCTIPLRSCLDAMRKADSLTEAVVVGDLWLASGHVAADDLRNYVDQHAGWRGIAQARRALGHLDAMSRGPWETRMRMIWVHDAGLPQPLVNPPVFSLDGTLLGYPDLLDAEAATVFEYDGDGHRRPRQHADDNRREERFEDHQLVVGRVTKMDLPRRHDVARRMRRARARGLRRDRSRDRWTLKAPPQWREGSARDAVLDLLEEMDRTWRSP